MSNLHLPNYAPIYPTTKTVRPRQSTSKLPNWGIEQRRTRGQNQTAPEWSLKWILRPIEANTLDLFLKEQAKAGAWFLWTPPGATQARFRCTSWTKQLSAPTVWEFQATFREVFSFTLPSLGASTGYFALTGQSQFLYSQVLSPIKGNFSLVGNQVVLVKTRPIYVDTGAFNISSGGALLLTASLLPAETGTFNLASLNAVFTYFTTQSSYFNDIASQIWGWDREFQVDWWGD